MEGREALTVADEVVTLVLASSELEDSGVTALTGDDVGGATDDVVVDEDEAFEVDEEDVDVDEDVDEDVLEVEEEVCEVDEVDGSTTASAGCVESKVAVFLTVFVRTAVSSDDLVVAVVV